MEFMCFNIPVDGYVYNYCIYIYNYYYYIYIYNYYYNIIHVHTFMYSTCPATYRGTPNQLNFYFSKRTFGSQHATRMLYTANN